MRGLVTNTVVLYGMGLGLNFGLGWSSTALAEGLLDVRPYVSAGVNYDSNLFRFSSNAEAKAAGFTQQSDTVKRLDAGVNASLRLSRQLIQFSANVNESRYSQYDFLDNTGKSYNLSWQWKLGSDVYGELGTSQSQSIAGFTDNDIISNNLRTFNRKRAMVNWRLLSDWTLHATREFGTFDNDLATFKNLDTEDDVTEVGVRYQNPLGTHVGVFYRLTDTAFPNRTPAARFFFGESTEQKQYGVNVSWLPSPLTKLSGQLSLVELTREGAPQRDFDGVNQRWNIEHALSAKTSLNASVYKEVTPLDDILATYAEFKGVSGGFYWAMTPKIGLNGALSYVERDFLGANAALTNATERNDTTKRGSLSLTYAPMNDALLQVAYTLEQRDANINAQDYQFQSINFLARYTF